MIATRGDMSAASSCVLSVGATRIIRANRYSSPRLCDAVSGSAEQRDASEMLPYDSSNMDSG